MPVVPWQIRPQRTGFLHPGIILHPDSDIPFRKQSRQGFRRRIVRQNGGKASPSLYMQLRICSRSFLNPNRSLDFGEIARLCHAACFSPSRRRSGLRRGVARIRMRTEAGKMPESLIFLTENSPGVSNDRFGLKFLAILKRMDFQGAVSGFCLPIGGFSGLVERGSMIAWLSSFEKRRAIPPNPLPMA